MKKKWLKIILVLLMLVSSVSGLSFTTKSVQAVSYTKKYLVPFNMPKKYWGTWHHGKDYYKISKRAINYNGYTNRIYKATPKSMKMPYKSRVLLAEKHGKQIILSIPQSDGYGLSRKGKYLIWYSMGITVKYHR